MNNTTTLTVISAILMAVTLVVGAGTLAAATPSAFASKKDNGNGNGNTAAIEKDKQGGTESGFDDTLEQEGQNMICTHLGNDASCSQEGVTSTLPVPMPTPAPQPTPTQVSGQGDGQNLCPPPATVSRPASITFSAQQIGTAIQGRFTMIVHFPLPGDENKVGTLNGLQISGSSFTAAGTELFSPCGASQLPTSVTISGQCGPGATIQYITADGEHATFVGNVACS